MPTHAFDVREAGVVDLLLDSRAMAIWELLRRLGTPCGVEDVSRWIECPASVVQAALERLARFGLVEAVRAGGRRPAIAYRVRRDRIVLAGSMRDPTDRALLRRYFDETQEANDRLLGGGPALQRRDETEELFEFLCAPVSLNDLEARELRRRMDEVMQFLKLLRAKHNGVRTRPPPRCTHSIMIRIQALAHPVPAQPDITIAERGKVPPPRAPMPAAGWHALSAREREIAIALMAGSTQPEIARSIGRSPHTVGTLTRRIYRKLGIRRRAELVNRLRVVDGPAQT